MSLTGIINTSFFSRPMAGFESGPCRRLPRFARLLSRFARLLSRFARLHNAYPCFYLFIFLSFFLFIPSKCFDPKIFFRPKKKFSTRKKIFDPKNFVDPKFFFSEFQVKFFFSGQKKDKKIKTRVCIM